MRIGIASIALEANTFNPVKTTLQDFESRTLLTGEDIWQLQDAHHELGGFLGRLQEDDVEVVPLLAALSAPGGTLTADAFDELRKRLHAQLDAAGHLDGILLAPHGAMVAENALDADGEWLAEVRQRVGAEVPIVATIDPHANLSPKMVASTDAIIAYKTNPHLDQRQRGLEAAALLIRAVRGEVRLTQAACFPPITIEIERQFSGDGAFAELLALSRQTQEQSGVLTSSIVLGFPYADVPELGSATLVVTNDNPAQAQELANSLGDELWNRRDALKSRLIPIEDAVRQAQASSGTTCLLDMGDNVGGGSPGDSTLIIEEIRRQSAGPALAVFIDAEAAQKAAEAGVGAKLRFQLGGKLDCTVGNPIDDEFTVQAVSDGRYTEDQPRHGGQQHIDQGTSAVLEAERLTIVVISKRVAPFSLQQVVHLNVDPAQFKIIVAKGVHAPVAAYAPVCAGFIRVNTPGITAADVKQFEFQHRRRPLFPFEIE